MNGLPTIPKTAPFDAAQRAWLNGYLAGLFSRGEEAIEAGGSIGEQGPLLFLWGSQTGSAQGLAMTFAKEAKRRGFAARAVDMEEYSGIDLASEKRICVVTSTYGDGEMPDNAQGFWDHLANGSAPNLADTEFAVLALGDTNYTLFCEAGKLFDKRLEELGARRLMDRVDCDVDYEEPSQKWFDALMAQLGSATEVGGAAAVAEEVAYSKKNPFPARVVANRNLNGEGSAKETRHVALSLEGSGLDYEVGDALGVYPSNCPEFVQEVLDACGLDGEEAVKAPGGSETALRHALSYEFDLAKFLEAAPERGISADELVGSLRRLQPRLYSIASSPRAHPGEVHLTVAIVRYELNGKSRKGVCSTYLADRSGEGPVPVFVHVSKSFRLPAPDVPIIMVGPGTGIAPFRAFLEDRRAVGASGRNWLFFGDQHERCDFLYRDELLAMKNDGHLTRLDTAFSRDQSQKVYVQDRMLEEGAELWKWLEEGASFYVCGDAKRMARDVDAALHRVIEIEGKRSPEEAQEYVKQLKSGRRYLRDVY